MRPPNLRLLIALLAMLAPLCAAHAQTADLILVGARVWTGDPKQPRARAVAVARDRILTVGTADEALSYRDPRPRELG